MTIENNLKELQSNERIYPRAFNEASPDHSERYHLALKYIKEGDKVLDAATGVGYGANYLAVNSRSSMVIGIDINEHAIEWGKKYFSSPKNIFIKADLLSNFSVDLPLQQFDVVTCFETIEHLKDDFIFLEKISRLLKPGGTLIISSPNEEVIPYEKNPFFQNGKNPHHVRHYTPYQLKQLLQNCGFYVLEAYTQCPDKIIRGENGHVIIYVCTNLTANHSYQMNSVEKGIEKLSVIQMRKEWSFLGNDISRNIDIASIDTKIDEILSSYQLFFTAHELIDNKKFDESLEILENIDKSYCPESYLLIGLVYQTRGYFYKAMEMYSKLLDLKYRLNPVIIEMAEKQLLRILSSIT